MRRVLARVSLVAAVAGVLAVVALAVRLDARVRAYLRGPALGAIRIYAAPAVLRPGLPGDPAGLARRLARLGYAEVADAPAAAGQFHAVAHAVELRRRDDGGVALVRVAFARDAVASIRDAGTGQGLDALTLRRELLAVGDRDGATLENDDERVPDACRDAVLAAEDRHFFQHPGVDPSAIVRALLADLRAGERVQGGSTITQQLVKNAFLTPGRTLGRKLREALLAVLVELHATKAEILDRYVASVYLGTDGGLPVHGFAHGALVHLGKRAGQLDVADCALLAGMIRSPNALTPRRHADAARARRDEVLAAMVEVGRLSAEAAAGARARPLTPAPPRTRSVANLYVADEVMRQLGRIGSTALVRSPGLVVETTIDAEAQRAAEDVVRRRLDELDPRRTRRLEGALVALEPGSGRIRALVGGRDYRSGPLDRAVRARRQPGSTFKPFVYLAALDPARTARPYTLATLVDDTPVSVQVPEGVWRPANYRGEYRGRVPLEDAMAHSLNAATVRVGLDVGVDATLRAARDLGITAPLPAVPALALGAGEVSLLELTAAYAVLADGGVAHASRLVERVVSADDEVLYAAADDARPVVDPAVAFLVTHMLEAVVERGTGRPVRAAGLRGPVAAKTGTTDDGRDAWFIGWTPDVVAGAWVGVERGRTRTSLTGATAALPLWTHFVRATSRPAPERGFSAPPGIVWRDVDPTTGLLATDDCPERRHVPFLPGTEPGTTCTEHRPVFTAVGDGVAEAARETGRALESAGRRVGRWFGDLFR